MPCSAPVPWVAVVDRSTDHVFVQRCPVRDKTILTAGGGYPLIEETRTRDKVQLFYEGSPTQSGNNKGALGVQRDPHTRGRWLRGSAQEDVRDREEGIVETHDLRENTTLQGSDAQNWGERGERVG